MSMGLILFVLFYNFEFGTETLASIHINFKKEIDGFDKTNLNKLCTLHQAQRPSSL
jgi:5,10-methylene-tetrahydrofolate dehydrogenase/methenyl tetrahydrofolate cyclohydrolase